MAKKKEQVKIMPNKENYDGVAIFDKPIRILDDENNPIPIYGLMFSKGRKHADDLWQWELNRYLAYLMACEVVQKQNGKLAPEMLLLGSGHSINLKVETKNVIYRLMKDDLIGFRIKEYIEPFMDIREGETEGDFVISESFIERYGFEIISLDTIMNENKNEKID